jgi:hypothetical protein
MEVHDKPDVHSETCIDVHRSKTTLHLRPQAAANGTVRPRIEADCSGGQQRAQQ